MGVEIGDVYFSELQEDIERTFSKFAQDKGLSLLRRQRAIAETYADRRQAPAPGVEKFVIERVQIYAPGTGRIAGPRRDGRLEL